MSSETKKKTRKSSRSKRKRVPEALNPFSFLSEKKESKFQIRIGQGLLAWIDKHAEEFNLHRSAVILQALVEYAGKIEGVKEARSHATLEALKESIPNQVKLIPNEDGSFTMQVMKPGVVRLDGEEDPEERKE